MLLAYCRENTKILRTILSYRFSDKRLVTSTQILSYISVLLHSSVDLLGFIINLIQPVLIREGVLNNQSYVTGL